MQKNFSLEELEQNLGQNIRRARLFKNWTRETLCQRADVSLNALKNLESGSGTIKTLVAVVRALGKVQWLDALAPQVSINPLHMVRGKPQRTRASRKTKEQNAND